MMTERALSLCDRGEGLVVGWLGSDPDGDGGSDGFPASHDRFKGSVVVVVDGTVEDECERACWFATGEMLGEHDLSFSDERVGLVAVETSLDRHDAPRGDVAGVDGEHCREWNVVVSYGRVNCRRGFNGSGFGPRRSSGLR